MSTTLTRSSFSDIDRLFRSVWSLPVVADGRATEGLAGFAPAADVYRDGENLVARFDLPGVNPDEDVTVEVEGRRLVVRGERKDSRDEESTGRRVREVRYGSFRRAVTLPVAVDHDAINASYDAGVLTVTVAGAYAGTTPKRIEVTTS